MKKWIVSSLFFVFASASFAANAAATDGVKMSAPGGQLASNVSAENAARLAEAFFELSPAVKPSLAILDQNEMDRTEGKWLAIIGAGVVAWCSQGNIGYSSGGGFYFNYSWNCRYQLP